MVRAYFENQGNDVNYVVNFTDVDDKMIRKAEQTGTTVPEVADKFINAYYEDLDGLGIPRATLNPRVTDNMENIIEFIQELIDRDFAYENGEMYSTGPASLTITEAVPAKSRRAAIRYPD